jgi:hypothetical protein
MQTVYNTTALTRTNVDKYLETAGFVPEATRQVIYYLLERPYLCDDLEQFVPNEATRAAYSCYVLYYDGHRISEYLKSATPSLKHSLPDPIIHGYIQDAARHLFEMINAGD